MLPLQSGTDTDQLRVDGGVVTISISRLQKSVTVILRIMVSVVLSPEMANKQERIILFHAGSQSQVYIELSSHYG